MKVSALKHFSCWTHAGHMTTRRGPDAARGPDVGIAGLALLAE